MNVNSDNLVEEFNEKPTLNGVINIGYYLFNQIHLDMIKSKSSIIDLKFDSKIEIKNLSFKYGIDEKLIIKNVNFEIKKGDILGIIGETGSGKTTFVDLLIGLLEPYDGKILTDGKNISSNKSQWFKKIGYVPQNIYLNDFWVLSWLFTNL